MRYGKTDVVVSSDENEMGKTAAASVAGTLRAVLAARGRAVIILAAGESQMTFLDALAAERGIDWGKVTCLNMDEFYEPRMPAEFTCGYQVRRQLYDKVRPGRVHLLRHDADDPGEEAGRFEALLRSEGPADILCQGIGTSGHLAFNEPFDAKFDDKAWVRVVCIAEQSRRQLRADPNFMSLGYIPERGITMTLPALLSAKHVFTMVPLALKRAILTRLFAHPKPTTELPATIISTVKGMLYMDRNSCPPELTCNTQDMGRVK
jgi:glucosamine-6-phosphate deaminase